MLEIKNLSMEIGKFYLQDLNLNLKTGEYCAILGKSGIGKTVFLETIAGRYRLKSGHIRKNKVDICKEPPEKRNIGFVYQNYELFSHLKVEDNIAFPLKFKKYKKNEIKKKTSEMMEILDISYLQGRYPNALSGGEKQRVAIGRSLISNPEILLLDEPFSALDYVNKESVKDMLKNIHKRFKPTVIHVTHDIKEALYFADKIGIIKNHTLVKILEKKDINTLENESELYKYIR